MACFGGQSRGNLPVHQALEVKMRPTSQVPSRSSMPGSKRPDTLGIRLIICLLDQRQMRLYADLRMDLVSYYRARGVQAAHIPVRNYKHPALSDRELTGFWRAYQRLEKLVLIHCSAGIGCTGKAASYLKRRSKNGTPQ